MINFFFNVLMNVVIVVDSLSLSLLPLVERFLVTHGSNIFD